MATVTKAELEYEGSITIDQEILDRTGIFPYEQVMISNLNNGERFDTYVIPGRRKSGEICLNGPTARKGLVGDRIIIFSYVYCDENLAPNIKPRIVILDKKNTIVREDVPI